MALFEKRELSNAEIISIIVMMTGIYFAREYWNAPPKALPVQEVQQSRP